MQSCFDTMSLTTLALIAAKVLESMYPRFSFHVKEDVLEINEYGSFPAYTVYSSNPEEDWITVYRIDHPDGSYTHMWTTCEYYTFISTVWEPVYNTFTREEEFEELFYNAVEEF